ncbi:MAG: thioredoxin family protein, partial [Bacteroidota bacterium]
CGPCKIQSPELEKLKKIKGDNVRIFKIDVDQYPDIAGSYQVSGVPTLILFKEGKILWRQSGVVPANQLSKIIEQSV